MSAVADELVVLVVDVGGNNVKMRLSTGTERRVFPSGRLMSAREMCEGVIARTGDWDYQRVSIGCPGPVRDNTLSLEPVNLGSGWRGFDFAAGFDVPVKVVNDALMQAVGSYDGGVMLFLGLGTGLGAALVCETAALPLEVAHLTYKPGAAPEASHTFEDCIGQRGLERLGLDAWLEDVLQASRQLCQALVADYVVVGGGNARLLPRPLPEGLRLGDNDNAFIGGVRVWHGAAHLA